MRAVQVTLQPTSVLASRVAGNNAPATGRAPGKVGTLKHAVLHIGCPDAGQVYCIACSAVVYSTYAQEYLVGIGYLVSRVVCGRT